MSAIEDLRGVAASVQEAGDLNDADAERIRELLAGEERLGEEVADLLFDLNSNLPTDKKCAAWSELFVYAITRYTLEDLESPGVVDDQEAAWLIERISADGRLDDVELSLLVNVLARAEDCDPTLQEFVLASLRSEVRSRGVLDTTAAELVRRVIYAHGSGGGEQVDRAEADFLFDLHRATPKGTVHSKAWLDLFVEAITRHLLECGDRPGEVDEVAAAWLKERVSGDQAEQALLDRLRSRAAALPESLRA